VFIFDFMSCDNWCVSLQLGFYVRLCLIVCCVKPGVLCVFVFFNVMSQLGVCVILCLFVCCVTVVSLCVLCLIVCCVTAGYL
jgi:hypothetical protein